jgi:hypothetical protein
MKFQIRKGMNTCDGSDMFYIYKWDEQFSRWGYHAGFGDEAHARQYVDRLLHPVEESVIAEFSNE